MNHTGDAADTCVRVGGAGRVAGRAVQCHAHALRSTCLQRAHLPLARARKVRSPLPRAHRRPMTCNGQAGAGSCQPRGPSLGSESVGTGAVRGEEGVPASPQRVARNRVARLTRCVAPCLAASRSRPQARPLARRRTAARAADCRRASSSHADAALRQDRQTVRRLSQEPCQRGLQFAGRRDGSQAARLCQRTVPSRASARRQPRAASPAPPAPRCSNVTHTTAHRTVNAWGFKFMLARGWWRPQGTSAAGAERRRRPSAMKRPTLACECLLDSCDPL
jgi:hypothetical protein